MESFSNSRRSRSYRRTPSAMNEILTTPIRASKHLAIWIVWHSTGVSLCEHEQ